MKVVLDSWAVLRYLEGSQPASQDIDDLFGRATPLMSWINLGEVYYVLRRTHGEEAAAATARDLRSVLDARLPDDGLIIAAARIKADHPMAYADAFAAALAIRTDAVLWTGDDELVVDGSPWRWRDLRS